MRRVALLLALLFPAPFSLGQTLPDFSVAWISRTPKIDYVWDSARPEVEGWPAEGQIVEWVAHVRNNGTAPAHNIEWRWTIDGEIVASGTSTLQPGRYTEHILPWTWTFDRHEIAFEIDSDNAVAERQERNNRVLIHSDAITVAFYSEQSFWNATMQNLSRFDGGAVTLDDWLQRRILQFNEMAALAIYPETPEGVLDRWRIDAIHVVPDGALPLSPYPEVAAEYPESSRPIHFPNAADRSVDLQWGFTSFYPAPSKLADYQDSLVHELGHARYLVDVYAWGVSEFWGDRVNIIPGPPKSGQSWHHTPHRGLMNSQWGYIDRYSAVAMNRIAGRRATHGNYNPPENLGEFLNDLPRRNRVRIVRPDGSPVANAEVLLYQSSAEFFEDGVYPKTYDNEPDLERTTDADGWLELPRNPFSDGEIVHGRESGAGHGSNVTAILRATAGGEELWGYLESLDFNLAFWRGEVDVAEYTVTVGGPICSIARTPVPTHPGLESRVAAPNVFLSWRNDSPAVENDVWVSVNGGDPKLIAELPGDVTNLTRFIPRGRVAWWVISTYGDGCPTVRSSTAFFDHDIPDFQRRRGAKRP